MNEPQRDLKPCPFCGGPASLSPMTLSPKVKVSLWWKVRCDSFHCGGTTWALIGEEAAVQAWNQRDGQA